MKSLRLALLLAATLVPAALSAQSPLSGEWDATMETPGGPRSFKVLLQVDGEKVTGTVKRPTGDVPLAGTLKGDTLTFSYSISYNENTLVLTVVALVKGNSFTGSVDFGGNGEAAFSATKVAAPGKPEGDGVAG